jgi:hypothetical protein
LREAVVDDRPIAADALEFGMYAGDLSVPIKRDFRGRASTDRETTDVSVAEWMDSLPALPVAKNEK